MLEKRKKKPRWKEKEGGREREKEREGKRRIVYIYRRGRGKGRRVALKNTDESPVFKIPVRLRGFALREKGAGKRGRMGLVGIEVEGVAGKEVEGQEEARRRG